MSSRIFQSVIIQMKDATDRVIGVADNQGFVVASSDLSMIGSFLDDMQNLNADAPDQIFTSHLQDPRRAGQPVRLCRVRGRARRALPLYLCARRSRNE